uniref:Secreted protein n=1 Tax=Ascaris lumbricoides TaxID=6252 RepID=A0A0M3HR95_ASCLU
MFFVLAYFRRFFFFSICKTTSNDVQIVCLHFLHETNCNSIKEIYIDYLSTRDNSKKHPQVTEVESYADLFPLIEHLLVNVTMVTTIEIGPKNYSDQL